MYNLKDPKSHPLRSFVIFVAIAYLVFFALYGITLEHINKYNLEETKSNYKTRLKEYPSLNINDMLSATDKLIIKRYNLHTEHLYDKYELLKRFKPAFPFEYNGFSSSYSNLDFSKSRITPDDLDFRSSLDLIDKKLVYTGNIYKIKNPDYQSTGTWAVYFNEALQYSSSFPLDSDKTVAIGDHMFVYKFSIPKEVFFRVVYGFQNLKTEETEYFVVEKRLEVK